MIEITGKELRRFARMITSAQEMETHNHRQSMHGTPINYYEDKHFDALVNEYGFAHLNNYAPSPYDLYSVRIRKGQ